jgi:pyruvate-ferredoxin/flavodoxin oxidoreductase
VHLDDMLLLITQNDVVHRDVLDPTHRSYVEDFNVYIEIEDESGTAKPIACSRQLVLFAVERRKAWRMLQSKAGVENLDYIAQRKALASFEEDGVPMAERFVEIRKRFDEAF